ncbi:MAG: hypothetical protein ACREN3_14045, partial [Gemmatimonadaceae bacterium]
MKRKLVMVAVLGVVASVVACGGGQKSQAADTMQMAAPTTAAAPAGPQTPDAGGKIDSVTMHTDANGNYFKPKDFTVHQGDVIRFVLETGVHNVAFPADSNK